MAPLSVRGRTLITTGWHVKTRVHRYSSKIDNLGAAILYGHAKMGVKLGQYRCDAAQGFIGRVVGFTQVCQYHVLEVSVGNFA